MPARLSAFVIWALVAAGSVFWAYRFWAPAVPVPGHAQMIAEAAPARGDLTRLFGAAPVAPAAAAPTPVAASSRFRLLGVVAPKKTGGDQRAPSGVALLAVDGKPPRAFAVGSRVDGDLMLQSVSHRTAALGPAAGSPSLVLELAPLAAPATGSPPRAVPGGEPARPAGMPPGIGGVRPPNAQPQQAQPQQAEDDDEEEPPQQPAAPPQGRPGVAPGVATR